MKLIKELKTILIIAGIVILLVVVKLCTTGDFKGEISSAVEKTTSSSNLITTSELAKSSEKITILDIDGNASDSAFQSYQVLSMPFKKITEKGTLQKIRETGTMLVISSESISKSTKAWVILDQLGITNLFILNKNESETGNELLKYNFQPDTTTRLEIENNTEL